MKSTVPFEQDDGTVVQRVAHSFRIPSLVEVDGVMVAIADARYTSSNDNSFIETVAKFSVDNGETWETQIAVRNCRASLVSRVVDPTVIVKGNKIYILVGSYKSSRAYWTEHKGNDWEPLLAVGEVRKTNNSGNVAATIKWGNATPLVYRGPEKVAGASVRQFLGGVGTAITTTDGILVYPIQVMNKKNDVVSLVMTSADDGKTWRFANGMTDVGCTEPVVLEWEGKLILNTRVDIGYRKVYESTDMGETWKEVVGTLSRVWGNSPTRKGPGSKSSFIPVTIGGKRVMLFTHPLNYKGKWERDRLHLWLMDNNRIFDVGQISVGSENAAYSSLLYRDGKLFCLHETNLQEAYSIVFVRLIDELNVIKAVVASWVAQDNYFSHICTPTDPQTPPRGNGCGAPFPTVGIVGFLSDSVEEGVWHDVYHCMGANVIKGEKVPGGFRFKGSGGGAQWPVGKQGQNQLYHFANYMFTLVATVSINELPPDDSVVPLLGVSLDDSGEHKLLGLSYSSNLRWIPIYGTYQASSMRLLVPNKTHQVVLTYQDGVGSIYVDGRPLEESGKRLPGIWPQGIKISHFYIGGYENRSMKSDSHVTVTNVLLYNRQLNQSEVETVLLNRDKIAVATEVIPYLQRGSIIPTISVAPPTPFPTAGNTSKPLHRETQPSPGAPMAQGSTSITTSSGGKVVAGLNTSGIPDPE